MTNERKRDIEGDLEEWGAQSAPPPDSAFAEGLEADLRSAAHFAPRPSPEQQPQRARLLRPGLVLAALVAMAGLAVGALASIGSEDSATPAATPVAPSPNQPTASPTPTVEPMTPRPSPTAAFELAPLDPQPGTPDSDTPEQETAEAPPTSPAADDAEPGTVEPGTVEPGTVEPGTVEPGTAEPEGAESDGADPDAIPRPATPQPQASPTADETITASETPSPAPEPTITVRLGRTYLDAERARLGWVTNDAGTVAAWQVQVRRGDGARIVETLGPRRATVTVPRPERVRVFYRILGIDEAGAVVARSNEVRVTSGDAG